MSGRQTKKIRKYMRKFAKEEMLGNILVYQSLDLADRLRIAKAILLKEGDGTPGTSTRRYYIANTLIALFFLYVVGLQAWVLL